MWTFNPNSLTSLKRIDFELLTILAAYFQVDEPNSFGNTALHMACYMGQDCVATELVNCGANINQANHQGNTPLHLATISSSGVPCLELLVNNGADVNIQVKLTVLEEIDLRSLF